MKKKNYTVYTYYSHPLGARRGRRINHLTTHIYEKDNVQ